MDSKQTSLPRVPLALRWLDRRVAPLVEAGPRPLRVAALTALYLVATGVIALSAPSLALLVLGTGFAALVPLLEAWAWPAFLLAWVLAGRLTDDVYHPLLLAIVAIGSILGVSVRKFRQAAMLGHLVEEQRDELQTLVVERTTAERRAAEALQRLSLQLDLARRVQQRLVAMPDTRLQLDGLQLAVSGVSVASMQVCGDFYRAIRLTPTAVAVVIGDVMGRGVASALVMAMSVTLFEDAARLTHDPGEMLSMVNRRLCEGLGADYFVTAAVAVVEGETRRYRLANAGHEPPVLIRNGKATVVGPRPGLPLGIDRDEPFDVTTRPLRAGDRLVMFTDGLIGDDDRDTSSLDRRSLRRLLRRRKSEDARSLLRSLVPSMDIDDDVTLVVVDVERRPTS